jgi:hypothetical protein
MTASVSVRPTWPLLVAAGAITILSIAVLWPLRGVEQVCIAIYPAPPGCGAAEHHWAALVGIGLTVALLAAIFIANFTMREPRVTMIVLLAAMIAVIVIAAAVVAISQSGTWSGPIPIDPLVGG